MGFQRRTYRLKFADTDLNGLEVLMRGGSIEEIAHLSALASDGEDLLKPENAGSRSEMYTLLSKKIISWNYEDEDGEPIPPTPEAMAGEDAAVILAIVTGWSEAVAGVSRPLGRPSPNGAPSPEASIPMEPLSESQPS